MAKGVKTGGRIKGSRNKSTLKKEELRGVFEQRIAEDFELLLADQIKDAKNDNKARQYLFDQVIGKAKESVEVTGDLSLKLDV